MWSISNIQVSETGTPTEPVSLDDAKAWMKVDFTDDDDLITEMITTAREDVESILDLKLVPSIASFSLNTSKDGEEIFDFPFASNFSHVSALTVNRAIDGQSDQLQTIDQNYFFNGSLKIASEGRNKIAYTITPVVPETIKEAIKMLIAYRYNNRGDQEKQQGIPEDILSKIWKYKKISV